MIIEHKKSLTTLNTFGVNCIAKNFINIKKDEDIKESIQYLKKTNQSHFILGGGSNILLTQDVNAVVLFNQIKGINIKQEKKDSVIITIGSGEIWNDVVNWSIKNGLWGIENLILIPGTAGAAPIQNIGAYGVEIQDVLINVKGFNMESGKKQIFNTKECLFEYRNSIFKSKLKNNFFITEIQIRLYKIGKPILNYETLRIEVEELTKTPSLKKMGELVSEIRNSKLPNPLKIGNAGSFFKNPIVSLNQLNKIKKEYPNVKYFQLKNKAKLSAGWLIEKCGWKQKKQKKCGVYKNQALVLINFGNATGFEIKELANQINNDIKVKFGVILENEVQII
jgi:UDP-N-acetylmuramate dehydrogenase